jgi:hypothetical protein
MNVDSLKSDYLLYFGLFSIIIAIANLLKRQFRLSWDKTEGKILRSNVTEETSKVDGIEGRTNPYRPVKKYRSKYFMPWFEFIYVVGDYKYNSKQMYSAPLFWLRSSDILPFASDSYVWVYFNSKNPQKSFVKHSSIWPSVFLLLVGFFVIGVRLFV